MIPSYLIDMIDRGAKETVAAYDELPLWSAPFGLHLLQTVRYKPDLIALDVGSGTGFPAIELAQRIGPSGKIFALDPWYPAVHRAQEKASIHGTSNVHFVLGVAENIPFPDRTFDLVVSNNGLNNVNHIGQAANEIARVCRPGGQFVFTYNTAGTMDPFYDVFNVVLQQRGLLNEQQELSCHIKRLRPSFDEYSAHLCRTGFTVVSCVKGIFHLNFADGTSMLNHYLIRFYFLPAWKSLLKETDVCAVFMAIEEGLNDLARKHGVLSMPVPYICADCQRVVDPAAQI